MKLKFSSLHILVIEDHLGDYILLEEYLKEGHENIELSRAISFKQASEYLGSTSYDAVMLDLSLPDSGDASCLVKDVVKIAGTAPVIVLTGNSNKSLGVQTLSLGISDYLFKDELDSIQLIKSLDYSIERKKIENQLIESEKKYKSLFDLSPLPMWVVDREKLKFLSVNDAAIRMYGYTREEFLKMTVRDLWTEPDEPEIEDLVSGKRNDHFNLKISHVTKRGKKLFLDVQSNPILFDGIPARVSLVNNITAQLAAERDLTLSERRFKALVQDGSEIVMILDFDGKLSYASPASQTILGIDNAEILRHNFFYYIHEDDIDNVKNCIYQLHSQKKMQIPSYRIQKSDKDWRWIETIMTNLFDEPAVNGIVANSRDITEFVEQEKELKQSLERYNIVAKATSDTITDYDVSNDRMEYNEGIQNMFGYSVSQIATDGSWWDDKIHPDDKEMVQRRAEEVYKKEEHQLQLEYRFRCTDGTYKYILDRSYLLKDNEGKPMRMIGSMQDITELNNYIKTIENHNRKLKEISWTHSHVMRAPLARIMGLIDLLHNQEDIEDKCYLLDNILSSARELDAIIRKISSKAEHPAR